MQWTPLLVYRSAALLGSLVLAFDGFVVASELVLPEYAQNLMLAAIGALLALFIATYLHPLVRTHVHFLMLIVVAIVLTYSASVLHTTHLGLNEVLGSILLLCGSLIVFHRVWLITVNMLIGITIFVTAAVLVENPNISFDKFAVSVSAFALLFYVLIVANLRIREKGNQSEVAANAWFDNSADGLIYGDLNSRIVHRMNPTMARMFESDEPLDVAAAILEGIQTGAKTESDELLAYGAQAEEYEATFEFTSLTGKKFWGAFTLRQIELGAEKSTLVRIADVSTRVAYEAALREAKTEAEANALSRTRFLANMSHEIRTPMNGVIGMTSLLLDSNLDAEQRACMETIRSSGESLLTIINDILDFSKIDADQIELEQQAFDPESCAAEALEVVAPAAAEKSLCLTMTTSRLPIETHTGDVTRVRQVLVNLLSNAVKFTEAGCVNVHITTQADGMLSFEISDTGIGIAPAKLDNLFDAFTQADASTTRRFGGTGLGLSISKHLATLMGGDITVTSSVGEGSTFTFSIRAPRVTHSAVPLADVRVLLFDTPFAAERMAANLRLLCRHVEQVTNLEDLAKAGAAGEFDHIFLGTSPAFPDADVLLQTTRQGRAQHTLLAHITARQTSTGVQKVLRKPIRPSELGSVIQPELFAQSQPDTENELPELPAKGKRFLLAEDNPVNQQVALMMLDKLGVRADAVSNGREAIDVLRRHRYDCVFLDLQMPEIDGLEACHLIRQDETLHQPYIIAMTANAMSEDRAACTAAGMDNFLAKPARMQDLHHVLREALTSM